MTSREVPPGTLIFGFMYRDASCGGWTTDKGETLRMASRCRDVGLTPVALIRLRTTETLQETV